MVLIRSAFDRGMGGLKTRHGGDSMFEIGIYCILEPNQDA